MATNDDWIKALRNNPSALQPAAPPAQETPKFPIAPVDPTVVQAFQKIQENEAKAANAVPVNSEWFKGAAGVRENVQQSGFDATNFSSVRQGNEPLTQANFSFDISKFRSEIMPAGGSDSVLPTHSFLAVFSPFKDVIGGPLKDTRTPSQIRNEEAPSIALSLSQRVTLRCDNVILPALGLLQEQNIRRYGYGTVENAAYGINTGDVTMQFIVDRDSDVLFFFENWFDKIVNRDSKGGADMRSNRQGTKWAPYEVGFKDDYACPSINIFAYNRSNQNVFEYNIFDAFPVNMQSINLSWADENTLLKLSVTFAYTDFKINRPRKTTKQEEFDKMKERDWKQFEEQIAKSGAAGEELIRSRIDTEISASITPLLSNLTTYQEGVSLVKEPRKPKSTAAAAKPSTTATVTTVKDTSGNVIN